MPDELLPLNDDTLLKSLQMLQAAVNDLQQKVDASPSSTPEFKVTVVWLLVNTDIFVRCLQIWQDKRKWPMQLLAWVSRSLFELELWTRFVLKKKKYADAFAKDWIIDGIEICDAMKLSCKMDGLDDSDIQALYIKLTALRDQVMSNGRKHLNINDYLDELEVRDRYKVLNPLFSKLVHPTSWSVHWQHERLDPTGMRNWVILMGSLSASAVIRLILDHIARHRLEPA